MDNKFELIFNERLDAAELKNLPIDDNMNGIIEEEEKMKTTVGLVWITLVFS